MAGAKGRSTVGHRILMGFHENVKFSGGPASIVDMDFGYFEEEDRSPASYSNVEIDDNDDGDENSGNVAENKAFWEDQHQLLHATLVRTSSIESKIRQATKEAMREFQLGGGVCVCLRPVTGGCRNCMMRDICDRLRNAGFNSAICRTKWRKSPDIPSGEHTYLDVVDRTDSKKGEVRVVIELNFRAEFEMARASEDYNKLINRLPEVFVGKAERLRTLIKILCSAAKKCMKENKMHMGPWRKQKYMQAKWFGTCERTISTPFFTDLGFSDKQPKPKASMLTFDLLENLPSLQHFTAVEVV
ncbi:Protein of unknown function DUF506 [Macleaya cordata]|uniref:Uncharacterized protein n=1 Tax=Macleaya cordata TaxID=56857 RepID=A0A200QBB3_MACCD|nr:Protein of unknown function DUF506 [Macleaya cordata]